MSKALNAIFRNKNLLKSSCFASHSDRSLSKSHLLSGYQKFTPEERACRANKRTYLHRNDTLKRRVFYRGKVKIDWTAGKPKKTKIPTFTAQEETITDKPVDDVYLISNYKPNSYTLKESIIQLQEYAKLDFTDEESIVHLRMNFHDLTAKTGKKRKGKTPKGVKFLSTTEVPFPFNEPNKVGVFTDQEYLESLVLKNGAHASGSLLLIRQVLNDNVKCDCYLCTDGYSRIISEHKELNTKLGSYLPGTNWGVVTEDELLGKLKHLTTGIQFDNFSGDGKESLVKVGRINQPVEELTANIQHVVSKVKEEVFAAKKRTREDFISQLSINCGLEDIPILLDSLEPTDTEVSKEE